MTTQLEEEKRQHINHALSKARDVGEIKETTPPAERFRIVDAWFTAQKTTLNLYGVGALDDLREVALRLEEGRHAMRQECAPAHADVVRVDLVMCLTSRQEEVYLNGQKQERDKLFELSLYDIEEMVNGRPMVLRTHMHDRVDRFTDAFEDLCLSSQSKGNDHE